MYIVGTPSIVRIPNKFTCIKEKATHTINFFKIAHNIEIRQMLFGMCSKHHKKKVQDRTVAPTKLDLKHICIILRRWL
jgi:hypothetical protein